jgi:hypothetical protein
MSYLEIVTSDYFLRLALTQHRSSLYQNRIPYIQGYYIVIFFLVRLWCWSPRVYWATSPTFNPTQWLTLLKTDLLSSQAGQDHLHNFYTLSVSFSVARDREVVECANQISLKWLGMVAYTYNSSALEAEAGELRV